MIAGILIGTRCSQDSLDPKASEEGEVLCLGEGAAKDLAIQHGAKISRRLVLRQSRRTSLGISLSTFGILQRVRRGWTSGLARARSTIRLSRDTNLVG
jgi:hypothetical protein